MARQVTKIAHPWSRLIVDMVALMINFQLKSMSILINLDQCFQPFLPKGYIFRARGLPSRWPKYLKISIKFPYDKEKKPDIDINCLKKVLIMYALKLKVFTHCSACHPEALDVILVEYS